MPRLAAIGTFAVILVSGVVAWALPAYQDALFARYPNAAASFSSCIACHDSPSANALNGFGAAFLANGFVLDTALEALDSDGDGSSNGVELAASPATYPGDAGSKPGTSVIPSPATPTSANYTGLWWNAAESGWGIYVNHQGNTVFATLFTYNQSGAPLWLVMSSGQLQADGRTFSGELYAATGPAFNAVPFSPASLASVGTMSLAFSGANAASRTYTNGGATVSKNIEQLVYGSGAASCTTTTGNRMALANYQDLWWNPAEPGWGVNIAHQNDTLFATLFTYDLTGASLWLVMSAGPRQSDGSYQGDLYRSTGPAFNAQPFTPITPGNLTKVGTMRFTFADGITGALSYSVDGAAVSKPITRLAFGSPVPSCSSPVQATPASTNGPALYASNCAACHGQLASSSKGGATLARTQAAIAGNVGGMGYLSRLSVEQLQAIVAALAPVIAPPAACGSCHAIPPNAGGHARHSAGISCGTCHGSDYTTTTVSPATHRNGVADVLANIGWDARSGSCASSCHGTAQWSPTATLPCSSCHGVPPSTGHHRDHRSRSCSTCHGTGYSDTTVNAATHRNGVREVIASTGWNAAARSCANSCHGRENW